MEITEHKIGETFCLEDGTKFTRICTRTYLSTIRFALKTAFKQRAVFKIKKLN